MIECNSSTLSLMTLIANTQNIACDTIKVQAWIDIKMKWYKTWTIQEHSIQANTYVLPSTNDFYNISLYCTPWYLSCICHASVLYATCIMYMVTFCLCSLLYTGMVYWVWKNCTLTRYYTVISSSMQFKRLAYV